LSTRDAIRAELATLEAPAGPFDAHAHTGADVDGTTRDCAEHLRELEAIGGRSVVFPLHVEHGYAGENRRVLEECGRYPDRLVPFARLDPRTGRAGEEAVEALAAGARGLKLHPRSEEFPIDHPGVDAIAGVAAEARVPVLIHAGLGVASFGRPLLDLAERHRGCPIVLAHAAVSDLTWLHGEVVDHPNVFFDTSWWNPSDLLALYSLVPPGRILYGSDAPYMDMETVLAINLRCARFAGLPPEAIELVAGGQLDALLAGGPPHDAGPAPGPRRDASPPHAQRASTALAAAGGAYLGGGDAAQMLELARLAIGDGDSFGEAGPLLAELLEEAGAGGADAPWAVAMALTLVASPGVESPAAALAA
jgi:predicted TIM-barrel fold metal-dependent hydrolase